MGGLANLTANHYRKAMEALDAMFILKQVVEYSKCLLISIYHTVRHVRASNNKIHPA